MESVRPTPGTIPARDSAENSGPFRAGRPGTGLRGPELGSLDLNGTLLDPGGVGEPLGMTAEQSIQALDSVILRSMRMPAYADAWPTLARIHAAGLQLVSEATSSRRQAGPAALPTRPSGPGRRAAGGLPRRPPRLGRDGARRAGLRTDWVRVGSQIEELLEQRVTIATRHDPHIDLEELDGDEMVVRVSPAPAERNEGAQLADEALGVLSEVARDEHAAASELS